MLIRIIIYCETYKAYSKIRLLSCCVYEYISFLPETDNKRYNQKNKLDEKSYHYLYDPWRV